MIVRHVFPVEYRLFPCCDENMYNVVIIMRVFRATNPGSFKLELFVNNLSKPNASTFEKLGMLVSESMTAGYLMFIARFKQ